jgi:hypothetical protein
MTINNKLSRNWAPFLITVPHIMAKAVTLLLCTEKVMGSTLSLKTTYHDIFLGFQQFCTEEVRSSNSVLKTIYPDTDFHGFYQQLLG